MVKTHRQVKVVEKTIETLNNNKPLNKAKILENVGYSKNITKTPSQVYNTQYVKNELSKVINKLKENRDEAIGMLSKKIKKAQYNHIITGVDVLTKNIELLSGNATEREAMVLDEEQKQGIAKELLNRLTLAKDTE